ncbi:hypothetical protein V5799_005075 [Amblyomma americanum]|uniref:CCHC-type domain-containing protein n=1 Tax=Amblyomma americanum TaxID=6943 RepID=A0AAQ4E0A4_AMBAM
MYSKNAVLDKAPYPLATEERISLILSGIDDDTWANPLAAQCCTTVTELIDRAAQLDSRRRIITLDTRDAKDEPSTRRGQARLVNETVNAPQNNRGHEYSRPLQQRYGTARACFNCGDTGHLSRECSCQRPQPPSRRSNDDPAAATTPTETGHPSGKRIAFCTLPAARCQSLPAT